MGVLIGDEGFFRDRKGDYLESSSIPPLKVPNEMDSYVIDDLFVIPTAGGVVGEVEGEAYLNVPRPRPIQRSSDRAVVIQRLGDRSWVIVDASASQVWPRLRQYWFDPYWLDQGLELTRETPSLGLLETNWFVLDGNEFTQEKIRVIVEPGFQDDSAEVSLIHISVPQDQQVFEQVNWPQQSVDIEYAYELLEDLSTYLLEQIRVYQPSTVSFLAGNIPSEGRASMLSIDGQEVLNLKADFERSWVAVSRSLERAGVQIVEESMNDKYFMVSFARPTDDEEKGMFGRLLSIGSKQEKSYPYRVELQESSNSINVVVDPILETQSSGASVSEVDEQNAIELQAILLERIRDFIT